MHQCKTWPKLVHAIELHGSQTEAARRLGISQRAYARQEAKEPVRKATREQIAQALGIAAEQLAV